jgi:RNA polymerase sigma factor (sigma-70 family)
MNGHRSGRAFTRTLIERVVAGERCAVLYAQVAVWRPGASREQVEEAVQEACLRAERACHGQTEDEVFVWLRTTARRELGRIHERARREVLIDAAQLAQHAGLDTADAPEQELIDREDDAEIDRVAHAVLDRLSHRQRQVAALHLRGRKRPQIAAHLGITPRMVKRQLERIMIVGRAEMLSLAGHGCEVGEPLVARLVFGLASSREAGEAQLHLATCPQCGVLYERLDLWREKVAALLPIPAVEQARPGLAEWAVQRAGEGFASLKQQASAGYSRAVDPTPLAGVRPGAAAAAITGCLAIGGGTTYCVTQSVSPIGGLAQIVAPARDQQQPKPRKKRVAQELPTPTSTPSPIATPVVTPTAEPPEPSPQPAAEPPPRPTPEPTPPPIPEEEYEPLAPAASTASQPSSARPEPTPAPAPPGGPGEFDGP